MDERRRAELIESSHNGGLSGRSSKLISAQMTLRERGRNEDDDVDLSHACAGPRSIFNDRY